jgi:hypothetical protein
MYPRLLDDTDTDDRASAEVAEEVDREETVENVRSGDGQEEMAGVGGMDGEGDEARTGGATAAKSDSIDSSIIGDRFWRA